GRAAAVSGRSAAARRDRRAARARGRRAARRAAVRARGGHAAGGEQLDGAVSRSGHARGRARPRRRAGRARAALDRKSVVREGGWGGCVWGRGGGRRVRGGGVPRGAVVVLRERGAGAPRVAPLSGHEAAMQLVANSSMALYLDPDMRVAELDRVGALVERVPL